MAQSDAFFLIHNYNTVPDQLLSYCRPDNYAIVDCSDDGVTPQKLQYGGYRVSFVPNTGHNITTYFAWFAAHYDALPPLVLTGKGNMIGRHVSAEYMDRVCGNTWFTYLYEERAARARYAKPSADPSAIPPQWHGSETIPVNVSAQQRTVANRHKHGNGQDACSIAFLATESHFLERNTSWYMDQPTHLWEYFGTYDELLTFIYRDPVLPRYVEFSPGACYILTRDQIRQHPPVFYRNLNRLMDYTLTPGFPAEAYLIERMLPVIYAERYEVNPWMNDETHFLRKIATAREAVLTRRQLEAAERARKNSGLPGLVRRTGRKILGRS